MIGSLSWVENIDIKQCFHVGTFEHLKNWVLVSGKENHIKYRNFAKFPGEEILWKGTVSAEFRANHPKLCGNCSFPQNFHTRKFGEISVFYAVEKRILKDIFFKTCQILNIIECQILNTEHSFESFKSGKPFGSAPNLTRLFLVTRKNSSAS